MPPSCYSPTLPQVHKQLERGSWTDGAASRAPRFFGHERWRATAFVGRAAGERSSLGEGAGHHLTVARMHQWSSMYIERNKASTLRSEAFESICRVAKTQLYQILTQIEGPFFLKTINMTCSWCLESGAASSGKLCSSFRCCSLCRSPGNPMIESFLLIQQMLTVT